MINRLQATRFIVAHLTDEPVIASLGNAKFDLFTAQDRPQELLHVELYGTGFVHGAWSRHGAAAAESHHPGWGWALLMNLNSLPTAAARARKTSCILVWDNRQFELTGGQPTHTAYGADLSALAHAAGFHKVAAVESQEAFEPLFLRALREPGPWVIMLRAGSERATGRPPRVPPILNTVSCSVSRPAPIDPGSQK